MIKEIKLKNTFFFLTLLFYSIAFGQVGVNTVEPKGTLDVVGDASNSSKVDGVIAPRLTGQQLKDKDNVYNAAQDGIIVYVTNPLTEDNTSTRTVNIREKGYYHFDSTRGPDGQWIRMFSQYATILGGGVKGNASNGNSVEVISANETVGTTTLVTRTFTLTRNSIVSFNSSVPVENVRYANHQLINDGTSKLIGTNILMTGPSYNNVVIFRSAIPFSSSGNDYTTGIFQVNGQRVLNLAPGTYTVSLNAVVYADDQRGISAIFGGTSADTVLDIISHPLP
ncbi:hypothetical protein EG344_01740 [Chryseobacterium sp. G0162]|uniref:hypothetical protein n=1 Tax=Chryseobacterium sp. G0162 TaxID=2487063 RepID=UPI000F4E7A7E|nr:hypothetical protein [Chryseobacterium sp. G0162]AZB07653.1 hypothetical protein EG344_01740 [Chryseobacterium sp. G0162]